LKVHHQGIPFDPTARIHLAENLPGLLEAFRQCSGAARPRIALYGLGPVGQVLAELLGDCPEVALVALFDRSVQLSLAGLPVQRPDALGTTGPIDLLVVATNPVHHESILAVLDEAGFAQSPVLLLYRGLTVGDTGRLLDAGDYYTANLDLRNQLQQHPQDPELLALSARMEAAYRADPGLRARLADEVPGPYTSNLQVIDACNLRCIMCFRQAAPYAAAGQFVRPMTLEMFRVFLDACRGSLVGTLYLGGSGEAFLHPEALAMLDLVLERGIRAHFITNGTRLTDPVVAQLSEREGFGLEFSIDAFEPEAYEAIRVGADRDQVFRSMETLAAAVQAKGRDIALALTMVLMRRNLEELPKLVQFAARIGIRQMTAMHVVVSGQIRTEPEESLVFHPELYNEVHARSMELAAALGVNLAAPPPFRLEADPAVPAEPAAKPWQMCAFPWSRLDMGNSGYSICCGGHPGLEFSPAFLGRPERGSWSYEEITGFATLHELFNSPPMAVLRDQLLRGEPNRYCRNCSAGAHKSQDFLFSSAFNPAAMGDAALYDEALERFRAKFGGTAYLRRMLETGPG